MLHAVILAGGSGTRFWPLSTKDNPKQCLSLHTSKSLIQETVDRLVPIVPNNRIRIVTSEALADKMRTFVSVRFVLEPAARNTTGAIGLACVELLNIDPDATVIVESSDHVYADENLYRSYLIKAVALAEQGHLITLGIKPTYPATGYGYMKKRAGEGPICSVERFEEKPTKERAAAFLASGEYFWNSGVYAFKATALLEELRRHQPAIHEMLMDISRGSDAATVFPHLPSISIDYALWEKTEKLVMLPADMPWEDVGTWLSLERALPHDSLNNSSLGTFVPLDSSGNIVYAHNLVATIGVHDLVIVQTPRAVLVCKKELVEDVKKLVEALKERGLNEYL